MRGGGRGWGGVHQGTLAAEVVSSLRCQVREDEGRVRLAERVSGWPDLCRQEGKKRDEGASFFSFYFLCFIFFIVLFILFPFLFSGEK